MIQWTTASALSVVPIAVVVWGCSSGDDSTGSEGGTGGAQATGGNGGSQSVSVGTASSTTGGGSEFMTALEATVRDFISARADFFNPAFVETSDGRSGIVEGPELASNPTAAPTDAAVPEATAPTAPANAAKATAEEGVGPVPPEVTGHGSCQRDSDCMAYPGPILLANDFEESPRSACCYAACVSSLAVISKTLLRQANAAADRACAPYRSGKEPCPPPAPCRRSQPAPVASQWTVVPRCEQKRCTGDAVPR